MTDALYKSLCHHCKLDDPAQTKKITLPYGRPRTNKEGEELVPFPPNDPQRGDTFADRIKALLRRHVVERCIYGVDLNPMAVQLARLLGHPVTTETMSGMWQWTARGRESDS